MATNLTKPVPENQRQRAATNPIGFVFDAGDGSRLREHKLLIRPEDLTVTYPSRTTVVQTLGSEPFVDSFGEGVRQISLSGITGYRVPNDKRGYSARDELQAINNIFNVEWHAARKNAIANGRDPRTVELFYVDVLNGLTWLVVPMSFTLRRSKSRPLLHSYSLSAVRLRDASVRFLPEVSVSFDSGIDPTETTGPAAAEAKKKTALESIRDAIKKINEVADNARKWLDQNIATPVESFTAMTSSVLNTVVSTRDNLLSVADPLLATASLLCQAGRNISHTIATIEGLPQSVKAKFKELASAYNGVVCVFRNVFNDNRPVLPEYSPLYGASTCSSTSGGRPLSPLRDQNSLEKVAPISTSPIVQTPEARASALYMANVDPVLSPPSTGTMAANMAIIANGTAVA